MRASLPNFEITGIAQALIFAGTKGPVTFQLQACDFAFISSWMVMPFQALATLLARWSKQQETALLQMTKRNTAGKRIAGFSKSERADAKFLLLAGLPFLGLPILDLAGLSSGVLWHAWFWLSAIWAALIAGVNLRVYWRVLRQSVRKED